MEWLNDQSPTSPNPRRRPWAPYGTSHTAQNCPLPAYHPPSLLLDKVKCKPQKGSRPPSPALHGKARKSARQPPKPVRPLSLKQHAASPPQLEPPPLKRPLSIQDMFNLHPPPQPALLPNIPAPAHSPSPRITTFFALPPPSHRPYSALVLALVQHVIPLITSQTYRPIPPYGRHNNSVPRKQAGSPQP